MGWVYFHAVYVFCCAIPACANTGDNALPGAPGRHATATCPIAVDRRLLLALLCIHCDHAPRCVRMTLRARCCAPCLPPSYYAICSDILYTA